MTYLPMHEAQRRLIIACSKLSDVGIKPYNVYQPLIAGYTDGDTLLDILPEVLDDFVSEFERQVNERLKLHETIRQEKTT